jgi:hypothetical protein
MKKTLIFLSSFMMTSLSNVTLAATDSEEMWNTIKKQQAQIDALNAKIEATADAMESNSSSSSQSKTTIGGYGELHYNNIKGKDAAIDFHRFVLFFGHKFTDKIKFYSEFELEHALVKDTDDGSNGGEVELEQAFIDFNYAGNHHLKAGLFLIPVGIINETHEPPTFYGVERNNVEKQIIPATWWEAGLGFNGEISPGLQYDVAITSGLNNTSGSIRSGRQKVAKATAEDLAYTARIKWTGVAGMEFATTLQYQTDLSQGASTTANSALLIEAHAIVNMGKFGIKALYAQWDIDGLSNGAEEQNGYYIEPTFKITDSFGLFARLSEYDKTAASSTDTSVEQFDIGFNYWPHENVVIKFDYQNQDNNASNSTAKGYNLGVGYNF